MQKIAREGTPIEQESRVTRPLLNIAGHDVPGIPGRGTLLSRQLNRNREMRDFVAVRK
jgi:hypothetical protein